MHIVFAASECIPYSKTGGLADVMGALPQALAHAGHDVSVFCPQVSRHSSGFARNNHPQPDDPFRRPLSLLLDSQTGETFRVSKSLFRRLPALL